MESIIRNCLVYHGVGGDCQIWGDSGDICIKFPGPAGGTVRRSRKGASGKFYVPISADGREAEVDLSKLFVAI